MKKGNLKSIVISGAVIISTVVLGIVVMTIKGAVGRDKSNLFAYAVDLENENWAYALTPRFRILKVILKTMHL